MKISCNILKKYIKNSDSIDFLKVWDIFGIRTAEVEGVEIKGKDLKDVVVAEIIECSVHPKKDKYHILKVDTGEKIVDILCGAPNVRKGLKAPLVKVGGMVAGFTIEEKEIAGILSQGMLCSPRELGISEAHEGILELPDNYVVGKNIKDYYPIDDIIVEIDNKSLTHRPDLWGHYGIAREIAAITNHELVELPLLDIPNNKEKLDIKINSELCLRYMGLKIENITTFVTPMDIQIALYYVGMRSISLLVDLTNYIMIELGQPMHAFDARRVKSIEIGLAKKDDKFTTLDNVERTLSNEDLMIKKNNEYFAIAGVMGGIDSEILPDTNSIILESANFDPYSIRKTAIRLGLRTDASARYEKTLDPNMTEIAAKRFSYLLKNIDSNINFTSKLTDVYSKPLKEGKIKLYRKTIDKNINEEIKDDQVIGILTSLGFKVKALKEYFEVLVPTYRATKDITIEADLIEEIARMYGYENFKKEPLKVDMTFKDNTSQYQLFYNIKRYLATKYKMNEVHSYLWYKTSFLNKLKINKDNVKLLGKSEDNILRDDMTLSLLDIVSLNMKNSLNVKIFEIGTIIKDNTNKQLLSVIIGDEVDKTSDVYYLIKEIAKDIIKTFKGLDIIFTKSSFEPYYNENLSLDIKTNNLKIGEIKALNTNFTNLISRKKVIISLEIDMDVLFSLDKTINYYEDISKYPTVSLDYTILTDKNDKYSNLDKVLNDFKSELILEQIYVNRYVTDKDIRITIRYIIGSKEQTLNEKQIESFKEKFIKHLNNNNLNIVE